MKALVPHVLQSPNSLQAVTTVSFQVRTIISIEKDTAICSTNFPAGNPVCFKSFLSPDFRIPTVLSAVPFDFGLYPD
eukprot:3696789-Amphidinium_carterae.1